MNLYHYCSNAAFLSILLTREIWASEFSLSNDPMEGKWIREVFAQYCDERQLEAHYKARLLEYLDVVIQNSGAAGFCMSEEGDLLSQWRAYADNGAGVAIGFSKEYLELLGTTKRDRNDSFNASLTQVQYDIIEQKKLIAEYADEILKLASQGVLQSPSLLMISDADEQERKTKLGQLMLRFIFFVFHLFAMKNPGFKEEREWRVISYIFRSGKEDQRGDLRSMEFRSLVDRIIPFRRIPLEDLGQQAINEIVVGPRNITHDYIFGEILEKYTFTNVAVRRSIVSYR
jgi:hypothetical protein